MSKAKFVALTLAIFTLLMGAVAFAANSGGKPIATPFDVNNTALVTTAAGIRAGSTALGSPGDPVSFSQSVINAGNYLKKMQADVTEDNAGNLSGISESPNDPDDGGWDWMVTSPPAPFFHTTAASALNLYGVTALGIYYAYLKTNDATYFTAMQDAADKMIANAGIRSADDLKFLMLFDDLPAVTGTIYQDAAKAKYDARIVVYGTADSLAKYIRNVRGVTQGYPNGIIGWDIGKWAVVAQMLYDRYTSSYDLDADAIAEVLWQDSYNDTPGLFDVEDDDGFDPTYTNRNYWWYTLGLSGLLDAFRASNTHTAEIPDLLTRLQASQFTTGAISGSYGANADDEDWQSTGCVIRSLYDYSATTYATEIARGAYWAAATQDVSGGWVYSNGNHYPEVSAEATYAVTLGTTPSVVWVDDSWTSQADVDVYNLANSTSLVWGYDAFAVIANGITGVASGGTVNVLAGNYPEYSLLVNKPLTIQGTGLPTIDATGFASSGLYVVDINITSGNVLFDGFKIKTGGLRGIHVNAPLATSVVTITHNTLIGFGVNTDPTPGDNYGLIAGYGMLGKLVFNYNTVSEFYGNTLLLEKMLGETEIMHNDFFHTYTIFYMTYGGSHVTTLQKVSANTFDVGGVDGGSSGVYFNSATNYGPALRVGKYTNVEISDNIFNNVGDNDRAVGMGNDNNVNGTDGEIVAPRILRNTITGTGSVTNCRGIQLIGYITDAVVEDNVISGVKEGIRLWNGLYSPSFYPVRVALTDNTFLHNETGLNNMGASLTATSNIFSNTTNASDSKPLNTYTQNCWSDWSGVGAYAIGGGGGNSDASPNADCGLDMTPNSIAWNCAINFTFDVAIGRAVTALDAANIHIEYPSELNVLIVNGTSSNFFLAYTQTHHAAGLKDTLKVNLGVLTGVQDGPATLFTVTMNGTTSVCGSNQLKMIYGDLRDSTNTQIVAPLASPTTFTSDCYDPNVVINSPVAGGYYNAPPVLNLTATDDCDLNAVYYQIDACLPGGWLPIASGLSGTTYGPTNWVVPGFVGLTDASHCIRFKVMDDFGRGNADSCSYTWCFTKDVIPPAPPTNLAATPGHNKVHLSWTNASSDHNLTVVMRTDWYAGGHGYPEYDDNNAEGPYPISLLTGDQVYSGIGSTQIDISDLSNATRDVYHYAAFTVDSAGNVSIPSNGARSTSYWLGDIKSPYDGSVYSQDLIPFSSSYGKQHGNAGYNNEADFGPTHNMSPKGIPLTDSKVEFEDLVIFSINFDAVSPLIKTRPLFTGIPMQRETGLRLVQGMTTTTFNVDLYLDNRDDLAKALIGEITYDPDKLEYMSTVEGRELATSQLPVFFKALTSPKQISVSAAVLGNGSTFDGSGLIATISFRLLGSGKTTVALTRADIRDKDNRSLVVDANIQLPEMEAVANVDIPTDYVIEQNQPNPFNPETHIKYALPSATKVCVRVYNVVGQLVKTLVDDYQAAGQHQVVWNGTNENGERVASGIYLYRFETPDYQKTLKMTLLK